MDSRSPGRSRCRGGSTAGAPGDSRGQLIVLCGSSFSGKSTVATWLADALGGCVVSFDAINEARGLHGGQGVPLTEWARTGQIATEQARQGLQDAQTVVVDDTSSPRFLRDRWRSLAQELEVPAVLVLVDAAPDTIRRRQVANRASGARRDVTDAVMAEHLATFEPPGPDEHAVRVTAEDSTPQQVVNAVTDVLDRTR